MTANYSNLAVLIVVRIDQFVRKAVITLFKNKLVSLIKTTQNNIFNMFN